MFAVEFRDYVRILKKNWILIVALAVIVTGLSAAVTFTQTPKYEAESKLYVSVRSGGASVGDLQQGTIFARQAVISYVDVVGTAIVTDQVAQELGGRLSSSEVAKRLSASSPADTVLINIRATDEDPQLAVEIANTASTVFSQVVMDRLEKPSEGSPARVQIDILEFAGVPESPVSPTVGMNLVLGLFVGLALGVGVAIIRAILDVRINDKTDVSQVTSLPIIGGITKDPKAPSRPLLMHEDPLCGKAEAYRQLRTNLQFLKVEGNPHAFVITSPSSEEGKTTTAANLAIALAETHASVCLVDADLRNPKIAEMFDINGEVGITDVIIGHATAEDALQAWGSNTLHIMPSGHPAPNPSELLGSAEMEALIAGLRSVYDYVIVDAPPILTVTDALLVAQSVDGALMVAAAGQTTKPLLEAALQSLDTIDANVLGVILTMVPEHGPDVSVIGASRYWGHRGR